MKLINIGFGNMVSAGRVVAVVSPDSAPVKRLVKEARERGMLIDASYGRSGRCLSWTPIMSCCPPFSPKRWQAAPPGRRAEHQWRKKHLMANDKFLFVVSGAAGTGKDSVVKALREAHPEIEKTVSATTRTPRPGEQEGVDYYYRTREQFQQLLENDQVVEHNFYNGNYYGTRRMFPGATTVFLLPPSVEELEHRLRGRGTETEESIQERLATARQELAEQDKFTVKLVNNQIEPCAAELYQVICQRAGLQG